MILARRSFLTGLSSLIAAPAIVRAGSLMPVRSYLTNEEIVNLVLQKINVLYGQMKIGDIITFANFENEPWIITGNINEVIQIKPMK